METIRLPTSSGSTNEFELVDVTGERMLKGCADTGVFRILAIEKEHLEDEAEQRDSDADIVSEEHDIEFATIQCDEPLAVAGTERGEDPYNRSGRWMKSS